MTVIPARLKALALLTADIGPAENPPGSNRNKYGKYWGLDGEPYCAMGVAWAYREAGAPLPNIQRAPNGLNGFWAYVPFGYGWAVNNDELTDNPQPGDIVLFGDDDHTGLFERWITPGFSFFSVEANTSDEDDVNGIYVARRHRWMDWVHGFWHPDAADVLVADGGEAFGAGFDVQLRPAAGKRSDDMAFACKAEGSDEVLIVAGNTFVSLAGRPWDDVLAGLLYEEAAGRIDPMPRDEAGNVALEVLPNPALNLRKAL